MFVYSDPKGTVRSGLSYPPVQSRTSAPLVKVNSTYMKLGTVQTGTEKVGPARKFKCTARFILVSHRFH